MFSPEAELEKEQCRLEGTLVDAAREYVRFRYVHGINDRQYRQEVLREKHDKIVEAVNALERNLRGERE